MIEIIPAIDVMEGKCVRLTQGDYARRDTYYDDPLEIAKHYEQAGVRRIHMVDLDGAKRSFPANLDALERVAVNTSLDIQYGGGVKSTGALKAVMDSGADRVIAGSVAIKEPDLLCRWLTDWGGAHVILGADVKDGFVATDGWLTASKSTVEDVISRFDGCGLRQVVCTDIARDGMLGGPSFALYERLMKKFPDLDIIASGGISSMEDIEELEKRGVRSVIVGKAIYEGRITFKQLKECLQRG